MEMKRLICSRNEHPDTCFLVEQEGQIGAIKYLVVPIDLVI